MSDLTKFEMRQFERLFGMSSGYVLNFSNRTFEDFIADSAKRIISEPKYYRHSGSKANRLRAFWEVEPNHVVGKLSADLLDYTRIEKLIENKDLFDSCQKIAQRLLHDAPAINIDALTPVSTEREFEALVNAVKISIENNEPESALDRLHTFFIKYLRLVCSGRKISIDREKPLHSLMGEYIKALKQQNAIESEMTERILKSTISHLDAFSRVRNEQSLAHDNRMLNYEESLLIFNQVTSTVRFIRAIEDRLAKQAAPVADDDIPF
ncbi:abortive infection family protein [Corallococcus exercitus]|uniref:Abortive infection family protein n=1 Tax=Corallococcus exercitus TaxID=2316736 RepID=A0A3A8IL38_9BACT|nr:abortive infection family protein [Corallococcus exercitus]NOK35023.1 abortive infection family protein [Corallococcus exercitus]RKG78961.1 abortive infection family protein [Corallococcus exercitus]